MSDVVFSDPITDRSGRGAMVICTLTAEDGRKYIGAARVMTTGLDRARERAEIQAREKAARDGFA